MPQTDDFGKHEVTHGSSMIQMMWNDYILEHEAVKTDKLMLKRAKLVDKLMCEFYQVWASKYL